MSAVKSEPTSDDEVDPLSSLGDAKVACLEQEVQLDVPVVKVESQHDDLFEEEESSKFVVPEHKYNIDTANDSPREVKKEEHGCDTEGANSEEDDKVDLGELKQYNPYFKPVLRNGPYSRSPDGIYVCNICNKTFGDNFNLKIHVRIHTGERPHVCTDCGKTFTQFSNLKIHRLVHTGERPHVCSNCGLSFRRMAHLQKHSRLHSGQRPHVCHICSKTFVCVTDLKNHAFTHATDRPHKCETCAKTFATPARLRRHLGTHS